MAKHTPGPWKVIGEGQAIEIRHDAGEILLGCKIYDLICMLPHHPDKKYHARYAANAHLIAAAPDLLAALERIVAISDRKHDAWDDAKAAIAKAKGES
jgi:hypothetical protein